MKNSSKNIEVKLVVVIVLLVLVASLAHAEQLAFPGAEGFGRYAKGGRGGKVLFITNLNDSGPGSLREAIDTSGPRTVIFRVSGVIELRKHIFIKDPYLTIVGQTAPGEGVCVGKNMIMVFGAHDVIIRHLRVRSGDTSGKEVDTLSIKDGKNVIYDHCSASWSVDENVSVTGESDNVTVQWCIIADSLNKSVHSKGPHGYGSLISLIPDGRVTYHHNLYAHNASRNPRPGGLPEKPGVLLDFRNNVIYDWGHHSGYSNDTACRINYVGNYLKAGPSTADRMRHFAFAPGGDKTKIFLADNFMVGEDAKNADNRLFIQPFRDQKIEEYLVDKPFDFAPVATDDSQTACQKVCAAVGALFPRRDAYDQRIIDEVRHGTGRIIDSQKEVGGWPSYPPAQPYRDDNHNGLPDEWEAKHRVSDPNADTDGDGYTNLEEFLNGTDPNSADLNSAEPADKGAAPTGKEASQPRVAVSPFGKMPDGTSVDLYTLTNANGLEVKVMTYGATLIGVKVPDRNRKFENVTLSLDSFDDYLRGHPFFGSVVGRYANRIAGARFLLDGVEYKLPANSGPNHIHGGKEGFQRLVWKAEPLRPNFGVGVTLSHVSPDGEAGYPGTLEVIVTYKLTDQNELILDYTAHTDKPTHVNLTNHAYWNLAGAGSGDVLSHVLMLDADQYLPADKAKIPSGELKSVEGTPMDFRRPMTIGSRIDQVEDRNYDHCYVLKTQPGSERRFFGGIAGISPAGAATRATPADTAAGGYSAPQAYRSVSSLAARLVDPGSGRVMEVFTSQPGVQLYTAKSLSSKLQAGGKHYGPYHGVCLETQHFPDSPNRPAFPSTVLRPGQTYQEITVYKFSVQK